MGVEGAIVRGSAEELPMRRKNETFPREKIILNTHRRRARRICEKFHKRPQALCHGAQTIRMPHPCREVSTEGGAA